MARSGERACILPEDLWWLISASVFWWMLSIFPGLVQWSPLNNVFHLPHPPAVPNPPLRTPRNLTFSADDSFSLVNVTVWNHGRWVFNHNAMQVAKVGRKRKYGWQNLWTILITRRLSPSVEVSSSKLLRKYSFVWMIGSKGQPFTARGK